jgi:hypothetical protein
MVRPKRKRRHSGAIIIFMCIGYHRPNWTDEPMYITFTFLCCFVEKKWLTHVSFRIHHDQKSLGSEPELSRSLIHVYSPFNGEIPYWFWPSTTQTTAIGAELSVGQPGPCPWPMKFFEEWNCLLLAATCLSSPAELSLFAMQYCFGLASLLFHAPNFKDKIKYSSYVCSETSCYTYE